MTFAGRNLDTRLGGRAGDVLLVLWILLLGWKLTYGLEHVIDIELADETYYLQSGLDFFGRHISPDWGPLYGFFYWLLSRVAPEPIALYMLNQKVETILLPITLFVGLRSLRVGRLPALVVAAYFLISAADLPISPKPMHFAMSLVLISLSLFFRLGVRRYGIQVLTLGAGLASLVRPEFFVAMLLLVCVQAYDMIRSKSFARPILISAACLVPVGILYHFLGLPGGGGRSFAAFTDHFVMNYARWHGIVGDSDPLKLSIMGSEFAGAKTVLAAAVANPAAFLHHVATNIVNLPRQFAAILLGHYDLITPRERHFAIFEALLALAVALGFLVRARRSISFDRSRVCSIEMACVVSLAVPVVAGAIVIAPRVHYVMAIEILIVVALAVSLRFDRARSPAPISRLAVPALLLLVATPAIGSLWWEMGGPPRDLALTPRPVLETIQFLRDLRSAEPLVVCESFTGAIDTYLGKGARSISIVEQKAEPIEAIVAREGINVFVIDSQFNDQRVIGLVPGLAALIAEPKSHGFRRRVLEDAGVTILISDRIKPSAGPAIDER